MEELNGRNFTYYEGLNDWNGNPIERTPNSNPYNFDTHVIYRQSNAKTYEEAVYSDRLFQWNPDKYDTLCEKHFGDRGQYWDSRNTTDIELFLTEYLEKDIKLCGVLKGCNQSSGYPFWVFLFDNVKGDLK